MKLIKSIMVMVALATTLVHAGDSVPFLLDTTTPVTDSLTVSWDAAWIGGDANATVVIADNGIEVKRTTGSGQFTYSLSNAVPHELTYTTYIDGVAQSEVYATTVCSRGIKVKVTFNANGGCLGESSRYVIPDSAIGTLPTPTRTGCAFGGWWTSASGGTQISASTTVTADVTYYAHWTVTVVFNAVSTSTVSRDYGQTIGTLPTPTRVGYTFAGWWTAANGGTQISALTTVTGNVTYYAHWQINQYTVTFNANGGTGGTSGRQNYGSAIVAPTVTRNGYTFRGWSPAVAATVPANDVTYTAQWEVQYTVTFDANGGTGGWSKKMDRGSAIVAPTVTREWCTFTGWSPAVAATVPANNVTYTAQWARWGDSISASKLGEKTMRELYPSDYARMTTVVLEEGVMYLPEGFFAGCDKVTSLTLPSTLRTIGYDDLPPLVRSSLTYDAKGFMVYQNWLLDYRNKNAASLVVPEGIVGIGKGALAEMYDLETVTLPQSLKHIGNEAFRNDSYLDNLVIPDGVEAIGISAFEDCSFLQTLTFGKGLKSVSVSAFSGCTQLSRAVFADGLLNIGASAFSGCWRMQSVSLPLSITNVASAAFHGCTSLTGVTVPSHGGRMTEWFAPVYSQILYVTVPEGETVVRDSMFKDCHRLQSVTLPEGITNIEWQAFLGCESLSEISLPESLVSIGGNAFHSCTALKAMVLPGKVKYLGESAFSGCGSLSELTLSRNLAELPECVFADCRSLDSFVVPASVTNLGSRFVSSGTRAIYYLGNAPAYASDAYADANSSLTSYVILGTKGWDGRPNSRDIPLWWNELKVMTWSANQFDVTFDANGGTFVPVSSATYACEEITYTGYSLPPFEPLRSGYQFNGYWTEPAAGTRITTSTRVELTKAHTLYAHWLKGAGTKVRFNANGGTVTPAENEYVAGAPYGALPVPTREHYVFDGWFTESRYGTRVTVSSEVPKANHELFAHWSPCRYTVRFHANNGTSSTVDQSFTYGETVTLRRNTFSCAGSQFSGWSLTPGGAAVYADGKTLTDLSAIQDGVLHLYAVWVGNTYAVRFDSHGGAGRMDDQTFTIGVAQPLSRCLFTRSGYTFAGWALSTTAGVRYSDGQTVKDLSTTRNATVVLYAVWTGNGSGGGNTPTPTTSYTVTFNANGGSGGTTRSVASGSAIGTLPTPTRNGYAFLGWFTSASGGTKVLATTRVTANVTYYAHWAYGGSIVVRSFESVKAGGAVRLVLGREGSSNGRIAVKVKTQTSTGICGTDFAYVNKIVTWENGDTSDKVIEIPTYASGAGKSLRVKLATLTTGTYAGCVAPTLESAKVYADMLPSNPGTITVTAPNPLSVVAGDVLRMTFSRVGGSDGKIAVKAKTQSSTAIMGINGSADFDYVKTTFAWADGDTSSKHLDIPTYIGPWEGVKMLRVKLATLATGAYAGNLVPALDQSKIYVDIKSPCAFGTVYVAPDTANPQAGQTLRLVFRRVGGSDCPIAVKYKVQTSTAIAGVDFVYKKGVIVWGDGEAGNQIVEVPTYPSAAGKQLRVKLSTLTQGDYAGHVTPHLNSAKVYVPLYGCDTCMDR